MKMAPSPVPAPSIERLANDLSTREAPDPFVEELAVWLATSARFRSYATTYRDKIRKKLRSATDPEALRDVRAELAAAHLLLTDRRMELAYEAYGSGVAGPDLTVTFRGSRTCNVEVTRLRRTPDATGVAGSLLAKLRQLPPSLPNVLLLALDAARADAIDVDAAVRMLRTRADGKDEAFFASHGLGNSRGFYERFLRLNAVIAWSEDADVERAVSWINRSARMTLREPVIRACVTCLRNDPATASGNPTSDRAVRGR